MSSQCPCADVEGSVAHCLFKTCSVSWMQIDAVNEKPRMGKRQWVGCWEAFSPQWDRKGQENPQSARSREQGRGMHADPGTMAKLVECVPNFSEGNNKEVRESEEGLTGGQCWGADGWAALAERPCRQHLLPDSALPSLKCCAAFPA